MNMNPFCGAILFYLFLTSTFLCGITWAASSDGVNRKISKPPPSATTAPPAPAEDYYSSTADDYDDEDYESTDNNSVAELNNTNNTSPLDVRLLTKSAEGTTTTHTPSSVRTTSADVNVIAGTSKNASRSSQVSQTLITTTTSWLSSSRRIVDESSLPIDDDESTFVTEGSGVTGFMHTDSSRRTPGDFEGSGFVPASTVDPRNPDEEPDTDEELEEGSGTAPSVGLGARPAYPVVDNNPWNDNITPPKVITEPTAATTETEDIVIATVPNVDNNKITEESDPDDEDPDIVAMFPTDEPAIVERPSNTAQNLLAQPAMLAAVIGGAVIGLLCAILLVMYLVYRMRKKDEGSYALDEPTKRPGGYMRAPTNSGKEYYA